MKKIILAAIMCLFFGYAEAQSTQWGPGPTPAPVDSLGKIFASKIYPINNGLKVIGQNWLIGYTQATNSTSTDFGGTVRVPFTTIGPVSKLALFIPSRTANGGTELPGLGTVFAYGSLEYPASGTTPPSFALAGNTTIPVWPQAAGGATTDILGTSIPAATTGYIRYGLFVLFPDSIVTTPTLGGGLTAGTYYYEETCVKSGAESGRSAEVTGTAATTNLSILIAITKSADPLSCDYRNIYRGTSSGAELYLASVQNPVLTYLDTGGSTITGVTPPSANQFPYTTQLLSTYTTTGVNCTGNGSNGVLSSGALSVAGPAVCYLAAPILLGDDASTPSVCALGDSIMAGVGMVGAAALNAGDAAPQANWFNRALGLSYNTLNMSLSNASVASLVSLSSKYGASQRLGVLQYCNYVVSDLGTNDIYVYSETWQQAAQYQMQMAQSVYLRGGRYVVTTLLPRVVTTDNMLTLGGQTPSASFESARENYNSWVRAGMQFSGTTPVLSGGIRSPYFYLSLDPAAALPEVNSSGVATANGGLWPVAASPAYTGQVITAATSSQITVSTASYPNHALVLGGVLSVTSGTASGENCIITGNSTTIINCALTPTVPSAGDTFSITYTIGYDGTHPSFVGHGDIAVVGNGAGAPSFQAWASANIVPF